LVLQKANNIGMRYVFEKNYEACILLNPDTVSDYKMVENLLRTYFLKSKKAKIGLIQPLLLLHDQPDLINSSGNPIHFLGFGYAGNYLKNKNIIQSDAEVLSATGGAALITKDFFLATGGFDQSFFMYCEDQNMCWQGLVFGYINITFLIKPLFITNIDLIEIRKKYFMLKEIG
jgi:GT2 family glycosyltransferase